MGDEYIEEYKENPDDINAHRLFGKQLKRKDIGPCIHFTYPAYDNPAEVKNSPENKIYNRRNGFNSVSE